MINRHNMYVGTLEQAINRVRTSRKPFAFIAESAMAKYFTKQSPCDIYMVGDFITIGKWPSNKKRGEVCLVLQHAQFLCSVAL